MRRFFPNLVVASLAAVLSLVGCGHDAYEVHVRAPVVPSSGMQNRSLRYEALEAQRIERVAFMRDAKKAVALAVAIHKNELAGAASARVLGLRPTDSSVLHDEAAPASSTPTIRMGFAFAIMDPALRPFFQCIVEHESINAGGYHAIGGGGKYQGAYQADANFVRAYAPAGAKHFADTGNWHMMSPADQDQMAMNGYAARGSQPWEGDHC